MLPSSSKAPWSDEEVARIRAWQGEERFHGLTCDRHSNDLLTVDTFGLRCAKCSYHQDWVPAWMIMRGPR